MKLPKVQTGVKRGCSINSSIEITNFGIMPSWSIGGLVSGAWDWVKKNGCKAACSTGEIGAKALCDATGGGEPCKLLASEAANRCRSAC